MLEAAAKAGAPQPLLTAQWADRRRQWRTRIRRVLDELDSAVWQVDADRYVQCAAWPEGLQIEAATGASLERDVPFAVRRHLQRYGWQPPRPPELPNHWQRLPTPADIDEAADLLLGAAAVLTEAEPAADTPSTTVAERADADRLDVFTAGFEKPDAQAPGWSRMGRSVLLVPFFKGSGELLEHAVQYWLTQTADRPAAVIDLFGTSTDVAGPRFRLPEQLQEAAGAANQCITLTVDEARLNSFGKPADLLRLTADLADATRALQEHGRDVVVAGPWALPDAWWLFAAAVHAVADAAVVLAKLHPDNLESWDGLASVLGPRDLYRFSRVRRVLVAVTDDEQRLAKLCEATGITDVEPVGAGSEAYELDYAVRAAIHAAMEGPL